MDKFRKIVSGALAVMSAVTLSGFGSVASTYGAQLTEATTSLTNSEFAASSTYNITFKVASATAVRQVRFIFTNTASGGTTIPTNMVTTAGTLSTLTLGSDTTANWDTFGAGASDSNFAATNGTIQLARETSAASVSAGDAFTVGFGGITNPDSTSACDAVTNSDSCFVRITTYSDNAGTTIDTTTATFTVGDKVTATATVDPILTFTVAGVASGSIGAVDLNTGTGTGVTSTATTLPFGNVTVGTAKKAQQQLNTLTNANNGYSVYGKFTGANIMIGSASASNNIDKFTGSGGTTTWSSPSAWAAPTGTAANVNAAWLGVRTNDSADISGFNTSDFYAPPDVSGDSGVGQLVMKSTTPDNGTSPVYVTFKIQANAFQPADAYSGDWRYTVVPSY